MTICGFCAQKPAASCVPTGAGTRFVRVNLIEMKSFSLLTGCVVAALSLHLMPLHAQDSPAPVKPAKAAKAKKADKAEKPAAKKAKGARLNHVVAFKFKEDARKEDIRKVEDAFRALKTKIPQVQKLVWGLNNSPEGMNKGCTHVWILSFNSEEDRNVYLTHPDHVEFGKLVKPMLADAFVADFWAKD